MAPKKKKTPKAAPSKIHGVINGAGVVVHTNLGRSVLAREAQEAVRVAGEALGGLG